MIKRIKNLAKKERASVALISVLIISAILVILTIGMSDNSISTSYQYLNKESNQNLYHTAESCLEETIIRMEEDTSFAGTTLSFNDITCTSIVTGISTKMILIEVTYLEYTQNYSAEVTITVNGQANNVTLLKWSKV